MSSLFDHKRAKKSSPALKDPDNEAIKAKKKQAKRISVKVNPNLETLINVFKDEARKEGFEYTDSGVLATFIEAGAKLWAAANAQKNAKSNSTATTPTDTSTDPTDPPVPSTLPHDTMREEPEQMIDDPNLQ